MTRPSRQRKGVLFAVAFTCKDVADLLRRSVRDIRESIKAGELVAYHVPGYGYRVLTYDLSVFMEPRVRDHGPDEPPPPSTTIEDLVHLGIQPHEARRLVKAGTREFYSVNAAADAVRMRPEKVKHAQRSGVLSIPITAENLENWIRCGAPMRSVARFNFDPMRSKT